jgi:hypothetical protein
LGEHHDRLIGIPNSNLISERVLSLFKHKLDRQATTRTQIAAEVRCQMIPPNIRHQFELPTAISEQLLKLARQRMASLPTQRTIDDRYHHLVDPIGSQNKATQVAVAQSIAITRPRRQLKPTKKSQIKSAIIQQPTLLEMEMMSDDDLIDQLRLRNLSNYDEDAAMLLDVVLARIPSHEIKGRQLRMDGKRAELIERLNDVILIEQEFQREAMYSELLTDIHIHNVDEATPSSQYSSPHHYHYGSINNPIQTPPLSSPAHREPEIRSGFSL